MPTKQPATISVTMYTDSAGSDTEILNKAFEFDLEMLLAEHMWMTSFENIFFGIFMKNIIFFSNLKQIAINLIPYTLYTQRLFL